MTNYTIKGTRLLVIQETRSVRQTVSYNDVTSTINSYVLVENVRFTDMQTAKKF